MVNAEKFFELAEMALKILADIEERLEELEKRLEQNSKPKLGGGSPAYEPIPYWLQPGFKLPPGTVICGGPGYTGGSICSSQDHKEKQ